MESALRRREQQLAAEPATLLALVHREPCQAIHWQLVSSEPARYVSWNPARRNRCGTETVIAEDFRRIVERYRDEGLGAPRLMILPREPREVFVERGLTTIELGPAMRLADGLLTPDQRSRAPTRSVVGYDRTVGCLRFPCSPREASCRPSGGASERTQPCAVRRNCAEQARSRRRWILEKLQHTREVPLADHDSRLLLDDRSCSWHGVANQKGGEVQSFMGRGGAEQLLLLAGHPQLDSFVAAGLGGIRL